MREDMFKVIVERPRRYGNSKAQGRRLKDFDALPTKIGSKRFVQVTRNWPKELNENLAPLRRYLGRQVGRPWSKVYAEICANLDADHTVKQHVRDHLSDFVVYRLGVGREGEWLDTESWVPRDARGWHQEFYVDPVDGILKDSAKYWCKQGIDPNPWKHRIKKDETDPDVVRLNDDQELRRIDGLWFAIAYRQCAGDLVETHVYDVIKKYSVPAGQRYAVSKRQLSARELAEYGIHNDNQEIDDKVPQRHKRKRKRNRP